MATSVFIPYIFFLAAYAACSLGDHQEYGVQMGDTVSTFKKLAPQSRAQSSDQCVMGCASEWSQGLRQIQGANLDPFPGLMTGEQVGKVCGVYDKTKTCLGKCPASTAQAAAEQGLVLPKYICTDSSTKQHAQCIYEAVQSVKSTCDGDSKCGKYKKVVDGAQPATEEALKEKMKNMCQYMTCQTDCVKPAVEQKCTAAAYTAIAGLPAKGAELLKAICDMHGMPQLYPQECRAIHA